MIKNTRYFKIIYQILLHLFALCGFCFVFVFFAMKYGWTSSSSSIDRQSEYFKNLRNNTNLQNAFDNSKNKDTIDYNSTDTSLNNNSQNIATNSKTINIADNFDIVKKSEIFKVIEIGINKDKELIKQVSTQINIEERLLLAPLVVEQLRLMNTQRDVFKRYFKPLSILGAQTQFSLGIYGIKEHTAKRIEYNLKDKNSPFYLGIEYENMLDYKDDNDVVISDESKKTQARILRLTSEKDHYYSYLYAGIYMKQIIKHWQDAGYNIIDRPEILATIYNLGFEKSSPKANPEVGGANIVIDDKTFTFGSLAFYFYYSDVLAEFK